MPFAQLVVGPPGAGKSTYCNGMQQFMGAIGRKASIVNLDPANDLTSYEAAVDVRELITLESIMDDAEMALGPNGSVLYALEELEHNVEWLHAKLKALGDDYVLFDCPGQVELFTHHDSLRRVFLGLQKMGYRLVVVNLIDSHALTLPSLYIATLLLSLRTMLQLDLPQINVLSKIDNLHKFPSLPFNLSYYTDVQDLDYLLPSLEEENPVFASPKWAGLNKAVCDLVEEFGLVGYETLCVEDKKSMMALLRVVDRAVGYVFAGGSGGAEAAGDSVWQVAMRQGEPRVDVADVQDRWIDRKEWWDEKEREEERAEQEKRRMEWEQGMDGETGEEKQNKKEEGMEEDEMGMDEDELEQWRKMPFDSGVKVRRTGPS